MLFVVNPGLKMIFCMVLFCFGASLIVGWWLAKCDKLRFIRIQGQPHSPEWLLFLGVMLVAGSVWWGLS